MHVNVNTPAPLRVVLGNGDVALYCRATIFDAAGAPVTTVSLPHISSGMYGADWTPVTIGHYSAIYRFYTDAGFTTAADLDQFGEDIEVTDTYGLIVRLLGLVHENAVLDNCTYSPSGKLLTGRLRQYDTKANAVAAGATGLLTTWSIVSTYDGFDRVATYRITLE